MKKIDKRKLFVRIVALVCAILLLGSAFLSVIMSIQ